VDRDAYIDDLLELIAKWIVDDLRAERTEGEDEAALMIIKTEQKEGT
jgi:hypothetical protein